MPSVLWTYLLTRNSFTWGKRKSQVVWDYIPITLVGQGLDICVSWLIPWSDLLKLYYWQGLSNMMPVEFWVNSTRESSFLGGPLGLIRTGNVWCVYSIPFNWRWMRFSPKPKHKFAPRMMIRQITFILWYLIYHFGFKIFSPCSRSYVEFFFFWAPIKCQML